MTLIQRQIQNIYLWEYSNPVEEYVLLSDWGSTNRWSELSLYGLSWVNNQWTYWQWYVQQTDTWGTYYKQFDKKIVGFKLVGACTNNSYDSFWMGLSPSVDFTSGNIPGLKNNLWFSANSNNYWWSSTWVVSCWESVNWSWTNYFQQDKNNSTTRVTFEWTLENGVWHIDISTAAWQSWSTDKTPDSANTDLYVVGFNAWRRYTWQAGNFYEMVIYLQWN